MKKTICLFFTLALVLTFSAAASATTLTPPYNLKWNANYYPGKDAHAPYWATFEVSLPSGDQLPTDISSYTPTSLTLTLDVVDPSAIWKVKVGDKNSLATVVTNPTKGGDYYHGTLTFTLDTTDFTNSSAALSPYNHSNAYNWYDSSIVFSAQATGCHVYGATYSVNATPTNTPEPGTILLLGLGMAGFAVLSMKFRPGTTALS